MKRIDYEPRQLFEEHTIFTDEMPYIIGLKKYLIDEVVPFHYSQAFELLICENLKGKVIIDNKHHTFNGNQVFIIPPGVIHSIIKKVNGRMFIFQTSFEYVSKYINIKNILLHRHCNIADLIFSNPEYAKVMNQIEKLLEDLEEIDDIYLKVQDLLSLFKIL